ncbi:MAG: hypothetical protein LQ346_005781 [Caloplaca aetnensis]|nr:MAG: hypothetical protein LQ346_005781 [Caloplaca aetnensis]
MILDSKNGADFGVLYVNRPTPDPDTQFQSLLDQPLIAGIPRGLRSEVDPASLIPLPTPTEGCHNRKRYVFYSGPKPTNTACLSAITASVPSPPKPEVTMDPSLVYLVWQPPQRYNMCRQWIGGHGGPPLTESIRSKIRLFVLSGLQTSPGRKMMAM